MAFGKPTGGGCSSKLVAAAALMLLLQSTIAIGAIGVFTDNKRMPSYGKCIITVEHNEDQGYGYELPS